MIHLLSHNCFIVTFFTADFNTFLPVVYHISKSRFIILLTLEFASIGSIISCYCCHFFQINAMHCCSLQHSSRLICSPSPSFPANDEQIPVAERSVCSRAYFLSSQQLMSPFTCRLLLSNMCRRDGCGSFK